MVDRQLLKPLLESAGDLRIVATASRASEALAILQSTEVDVVLLDAGVAGMDDVDLTQRILEVDPIPILMHLRKDDEEGWEDAESLDSMVREGAGSGSGPGGAAPEQHPAASASRGDAETAPARSGS